MSRRFWDKRESDIEKGIVHSGRLEAYIRGFQEVERPSFWSKTFIEQLMTAGNLVEQNRLFQAGISKEFEQAFRTYFGREKMAEQGRDPAQFQYVEDRDVGRYMYQRFVYACTQLPLNDNFYMEHFLTSNYRDLALGPPYLRRENFKRLKTLISRIHLSVCEIEQQLHSQSDGQYSKANLSDIFEYMSEDLSNAVFASLAEKLRAGGRIAYWNFLVPRRSPESLRSILRPLEALSQSLWRQDRSWFYRSFTVEERRV